MFKIGTKLLIVGILTQTIYFSSSLASKETAIASLTMFTEKVQAMSESVDEAINNTQAAITKQAELLDATGNLTAKGKTLISNIQDSAQNFILLDEDEEGNLLK